MTTRLLYDKIYSVYKEVLRLRKPCNLIAQFEGWGYLSEPGRVFLLVYASATDIQLEVSPDGATLVYNCPRLALTQPKYNGTWKLEGASVSPIWFIVDSRFDTPWARDGLRSASHRPPPRMVRWSFIAWIWRRWNTWLNKCSAWMDPKKLPGSKLILKRAMYRPRPSEIP